MKSPLLTFDMIFKTDHLPNIQHPLTRHAPPPTLILIRSASPIFPPVFPPPIDQLTGTDRKSARPSFRAPDRDGRATETESAGRRRDAASAAAVRAYGLILIRRNREKGDFCGKTDGVWPGYSWRLLGGPRGRLGGIYAEGLCPVCSANGGLLTLENI